MEETDMEGAPSRLLWVGNLAADATEALLIQTFAKYGAVDYVSAYPARSYAFIEFRDLEHAKEAKAGLQGKLLKGQSLRIEFAKPAKPSKHLWIWGVSETVTKEQLEAEFKKYGPLDDFRLLRDRKSALAEFRKLEHASAAVKGLNKKLIQGEELRVDFLRSHSGKRGHATLDSSSHSILDERASKEGEPSETLWIGFPPPSRVDEDGLRKAFILFGEVERFTTFPDRSYCFVQFRNVDEATRAKEGLQGRLLNDPRILIRFSSNEASRRNARLEGIHQSPHHVDIGGPKSFDWPGAMHPSTRFAIGHNDFRATKGFPRPTSTSGLLVPAPVRGVLSDGNDYFESRVRFADALNRPLLDNPGDAERDVAQREPKAPNFSALGHMERAEGGAGYDPQFWVPSKKHYQLNPMLYRGSDVGFDRSNAGNTFNAGSGTPDPEATWKGSIAKAGIFVCRVQSFPVGKGIDDSLPVIVNCVARTSLEMLAKHFVQAIDYGIVCFIPDGNSENASFQEFLSYLGDKQRAGVANTSDGTSLFLVPPSDFSENVLKLHGDCLFGLVIKFHQAESVALNDQHQPGARVLQVPEQHILHLQPRMASNEEQVLNTPVTGTILTQNQAASPQSKPDVFPHASILRAPNLRQQDGAEANGGIAPSNSDNMEKSCHENEARSDGTGSIHSYSRVIQTSWLGHTHQWDPSSSLTNPNLHASASGSSEARPIGAVEHVLSGLQAIPTASTATSHALLTQSGSFDGSGLASNISAAEALKMGLARRDGSLEGEASNRFQATLQLAAALLQRMHNGKGSAGPTS